MATYTVDNDTDLNQLRFRLSENDTVIFSDDFNRVITFEFNVDRLTFQGPGSLSGVTLKSGTDVGTVFISGNGGFAVTTANPSTSVYGGDGADTITIGEATDFDPMQIIFAGGGNDTIVFRGAAYVFGGAGSNTFDVSGGGGAIVDSYDGNNTITGNSGDAIAYFDFSNGVSIDLSRTDAQSKGEGRFDTISGINNLFGSSFGDDVLIGNAEANVLFGIEGNDKLVGRDGNDTLNGAVGNDILDGGRGADTMTGGAGNDTYRVDDLGDVVVELANEGTDTVVVGVSGYTMADNVEILRMAGSGNFEATGNALDNLMFGNKGDNALDGGEGADRMQGGLGNDVYYVDNAKDVIIEGDDGGIDGVLATVSYKLGASAQVEIMFAHPEVDETINLTGNNFGQTLIGNGSANVLQALGGNDLLSGDEGNDRLYGGLGEDTLTGGAGNDTFVFNTALSSDNVDTIEDFSNVLGNNDRMLLDDAVFTALTKGRLGADQFLDANSDFATSEAHRIVYNQSSGALFYDADGVGGQDGVQFAVLGNNADLGLSDFVIV